MICQGSSVRSKWVNMFCLTRKELQLRNSQRMAIVVYGGVT